MRVSIVGAGYVGLVTGACLADTGHDVVLVDLDEGRLREIETGSSPIHEPGLSEVLERNVGRRLRVTTEVAAAVLGSDLTLIAVGTPSSDDGIDLSAVVTAAREVGEALQTKDGYHAVVVKSTVVPGTTQGVVADALREASGRAATEHLGIGMNPEFLTEGQAIADFMSPDRLVLGADDVRTQEMLRDLYEPVNSSVPRLFTNTRTAEMIKYSSNALLATMISFANEIGNLCREVGGVDVVDVMRGVHTSDYLSPIGSGGERVTAPIASFLGAGCGFGGSCLPKDLRALIAEGQKRGRAMDVLRATLQVNGRQPDEILRIVEQEVGDLQGKSVTVLGLAFKPDTDDVRESPAIPIITRLLDQHAAVTVHDPIVNAIPEPLRGSEVTFEPDLLGALSDAAAVVLVTRWEDYRAVPSLLAGLDPAPVFVDGRRMLDAGDVARYAGVGRG